MSDGPDASRDFWLSRTAVEGPGAARFHDAHDAYDLAAIAPLAEGAQRVLDLGCGTCVLANLLVDRLGVRVHAVDYIPEFLTHAMDDPRLTTEAGDVREYVRADASYDVILSLGVITYLETEAERRAMYQHCATMLAPAGTLLVKAQFGVEETVEVDQHSEQFGRDYRATYPHLDGEVALLREVFGSVQVTDPYPAELNRWENTHFHHLIARHG
jgi:trans-aconitate methyltransferase